MLTLLLLASTLLPVQQAVPEITAPDVMVTIAPSSMDSYQLLKRRRTPDTYTCEAFVRDVDPPHRWLTATLVLLPGTSDTVTERAGEYSLEFKVKMMTLQAETSVTVKRGDKVLTRQRSTVYLRPSETENDRIIPVH